MEERVKIREMLARNLLTCVWLRNQLETVGMKSITAPVLSSTLNGVRRGPKATEIITKSLEILNAYEAAMAAIKSGIQFADDPDEERNHTTTDNEKKATA